MALLGIQARYGHYPPTRADSTQRLGLAALGYQCGYRLAG